MGAIASNTLALPAVAAFIAAMRLRFRSILMFTVLFGAIEWLFLQLGIYTHNWWRIAYTMLGLPFYFLSAKMLYARILQPLQVWHHSLILLLITQSLCANFHIFPIMLLSARYYRPGWFANQSHDTTAFSAIYYLCMSSILVLLIKVDWKRKWIKYALAAAFGATANIILMTVGILHSLKDWDPFYYILQPAIVLMIAGFISKRLSFGPRIH
jgi:hypothetical protein